MGRTCANSKHKQMNKQLQKVQTLPSLLCDDDGHYELACTKLEDRREYTANRLWKHYPAKYRLAVRLISEMLSTRMIAEACEVSPTTVEAIRLRERFSIEKEREQLLATVRAGTRICAERVVELATTMNAKEEFYLDEAAPRVLREGLLTGGMREELSLIVANRRD